MLLVSQAPKKRKGWGKIKFVLSYRHRLPAEIKIRRKQSIFSLLKPVTPASSMGTL